MVEVYTLVWSGVRLSSIVVQLDLVFKLLRKVRDFFFDSAFLVDLFTLAWSLVVQNALRYALSIQYGCTR